MSRGFLFLEVIVSVMLLAFAALALISINSNQKKLYDISKKEIEFCRYSSIAANRADRLDKKEDITLYALIKDDYDIKNPSLIKYLKNRSVHFEKGELSSFYVKTKDMDVAVRLKKISIDAKSGASIYIKLSK